MLKKRNIVIVLALFVALFTSCTLFSKDSTKLDAPEITLNGNIISWNRVDEATSYIEDKIKF